MSLTYRLFVQTPVYVISLGMEKAEKIHLTYHNISAILSFLFLPVVALGQLSESGAWTCHSRDQYEVIRVSPT